MYTELFSKRYYTAFILVCCIGLMGCITGRAFERPTPLSGDPFFADASFCSLSDEAGHVPGQARKHCCERKIQTATDSTYLFNLNKDNNAARITAEVAGLLRAELGLSADTKIVFRMKELKRWFATHCKRPGHCEGHTVGNTATCDSLYNQEVRQFNGFASASESVNFITEAAIKAYMELYTAGINISTTDSSTQVSGGNFYMKTVRKHPACSSFQTETLNPELWTAVADTSCH